MCKQKACLITLALVLSLASHVRARLSADPSIVLHYSFDAISDIVVDRSGNGHNGVVEGDIVVDPGGISRGAAKFAQGSYIDLNGPSFGPQDVPTSGMTLAAWAKCENTGGHHAIFNARASDSTWLVHPELRSNGQFRWLLRAAGGMTIFDIRAGAVTWDEWLHYAGLYDKASGTATLYINGEVVQQMTISNPPSIAGDWGSGARVGYNIDNARPFTGLMDLLYIFKRALSPGEIQEVMVGIPPGVADDPIPDNEEIDVPRDVVLGWTPGEYASELRGHSVYLSENYSDVNDGINGIVLDANTFAPDQLLDFGKTYYWRVDEVNAAPDFTVFEGDVWSFTVERFAYPITGITASASGSFGTSVPENTINGSGLSDDLHGVSAADMWISGGVPATIEYAFDRAYKLHELWIWNSNQLIEAFVGFGAKDVVIEYSKDGENWTVLEGVGPLVQAPGAEGYAHGSTIDFGGVTAQQVRMTVNSVQGIAPQASLSEVRFYFIPTFATRPDPDSGATNVAPDVTLSWGGKGREAVRHEIYVGVDPDNLAFAGGASESSLDTLALDLQLGQSYSWRVDEVNEAADPSTWQGAVWSFTTADTISIDDMESYKDEEFLEIWATWIDGFDDPGNNGAIVGAVPSLGDFSPETTIVSGGDQSLPIHFDNSGAPRSEATHTFDSAMDWTKHGVQSLSLYFQGASENSGGQLYVKINNTKIPYDGDAGDLSGATWLLWNIDLSNAGGDLSNVSSLTVGIEGAGAVGVVYIDDIRLNPLAP